MMSAAIDRTHACAPPRYPGHLVASQRLPDGTDIVIRPIRPEDDAIERAFIRGLSRDTGYKRLLSARKLTSEEIRHLTRIDYEQEMAFVAVTGGDGQARMLGVARYVRDAGDSGTDARDADAREADAGDADAGDAEARDAEAGGAEFAIVVADAWQRKGVGTFLLGTLMRHAHAAGIGRLHGITLASNQAMQNLARKLGFVQKNDPQDASVRHAEKTLATEVSPSAVRPNAEYPGTTATNDEGISLCNPLPPPDSVQDRTKNISEIA
jgi:RimJ/RimL family protein N-acetyltransferase